MRPRALINQRSIPARARARLPHSASAVRGKSLLFFFSFFFFESVSRVARIRAYISRRSIESGRRRYVCAFSTHTGANCTHCARARPVISANNREWHKFQAYVKAQYAIERHSPRARARAHRGGVEGAIKIINLIHRLGRASRQRDARLPARSHKSSGVSFIASRRDRPSE